MLRPAQFLLLTALPVLLSGVVRPPSLAPPEGGGCQVTFQGRHGGAAGRIDLFLGSSEVRTRVGWWSRIRSPRVGGSDGVVRLGPGDHFSEVYTLDLACNAHRRYRFTFLAYDGERSYEYTYYYPSEDDFTQDTFIDLGALRRFFPWIEPGPDAQRQPVALSGIDLDGEWVRSESNNDPNDGMRIRVEADRAVLTFVPATAGSAWQGGRLLWREITSDGALRALGSDGNYYPSRLTLRGANQLTLSIGHGGAGNDQTWVRERAAVASCLWTPSSAPSEADVRATTSASVPSSLSQALRSASAAGATIQTLALTPSDQWVMVADNTPCYSAGFPDGVREHIDDYIASGREIDVVAFGSGGRWLVIAEDWMRRSGVSDATAERIRQLQAANQRIDAFAFAPERAGWAMAAGGTFHGSGPFPDGFLAAVAAAQTGLRPIHDIAFGGDGAWALVAGDWFVTSGASLELLADLHRYRTDENRRIDHVVLPPGRGENHWAVLSNGPESAPETDAGQIERFLAPDSSGTIWTRMKAHRIRGLAIAVIQNNQVVWARGYGSRGIGVQAGGLPDVERYVYPTTVFDAASISKPVAAVGALRLVDEGRLGLTRGGVMQDLIGTVVPLTSAFRITSLDPAETVNLARLLNHCAGLDHAHGSSGAEGRSPDQNEPPIQKVILGTQPASSRHRVVRTFTPGDSMHYSGANYALIQGLIETHADGGFDGYMGALLGDLGMSDSAFRLPEDRAARYAYGRDENCTSCPALAYPNKAAAALTSTVIDLARFVIMLNQGGRYAGRRVLQQETVDRLLRRDGAPGSSLAERQCARPRTMGLGMRVLNTGTTSEVFYHRGTHNGFRAYVHGFPAFEDASGGHLPSGLVLLMAGGSGDATRFADELETRFRAVYGWPDYAN